MSAPGKDGCEPLAILDDQRPPPMVDRHWAAPGATSLQYAGQGVVFRPGADVYLQGSAWAPAGQEVNKLWTQVRVGPCIKSIRVLGERRWVRGFTGLRATSAMRFASMPLRYEHSHGGTALAEDGRIVAQDVRNPVGRGVYARPQDALDQPLPNLEDPDKPDTPCGYGPIPASWQPRLALAGTYDSRWVEERIPLWPQDLNPRFFHAAAPGLCAPGPLRGGEPVMLDGFSPDGEFRFLLPTYRVLAKSIYADRIVRGMMQLDGVLLEPDEHAVTLYWRRSVPLGHGAKIYLRSVIRLLEPWEDEPA
jgi:hypothetical protein